MKLHQVFEPVPLTNWCLTLVFPTESPLITCVCGFSVSEVKHGPNKIKGNFFIYFNLGSYLAATQNQQSFLYDMGNYLLCYHSLG